MNFHTARWTIIKAILVFAFSTSAALSQDFQPPSDLALKAVVYVYSLGTHNTIGRIKPSVFVDNKEVAQIRPARYFIMALEPGVHSVHFKKTKKRGGIEMDFKPGETYFLRVNWKTGGTVRAEGFDLVQPEASTYDIKQLKTVDADNLKDTSIAFLTIGGSRSN